MQTRNNHGELIGELNSSFTAQGDRITTNTLYNRGNPVSQHISVRDDRGKVTTTNVIGGKILP
jgi:hypothetical protein